MPFKANAAGRHHIPRQRHRVTNWSDYDAALRQRGSLTVWFTEAAIATWRAEPRTTPGGQPRYSALAITTAEAVMLKGPFPPIDGTHQARSAIGPTPQIHIQLHAIQNARGFCQRHGRPSSAPCLA